MMKNNGSEFYVRKESFYNNYDNKTTLELDVLSFVNN